MTYIRKRHSDAWDAPLTDEQRDEVFRKATQGGFSWESVSAWIGEEFHITPPKRPAFSRFLTWWRPEYVSRRYEERILARDALRGERVKVGDMSPETVQSLEDQASYWIAKGDLGAGKSLFGIAAKIRDDLRKNVELNIRRAAEERASQELQLKLRKLDLFESKLREAQDSGKAVDPKQLADEIDKLLGRKS